MCLYNFKDHLIEHLKDKKPVCPSKCHRSNPTRSFNLTGFSKGPNST